MAACLVGNPISPLAVDTAVLDEFATATTASSEFRASWGGASQMGGDGGWFLGCSHVDKLAVGARCDAQRVAKDVEVFGAVDLEAHHLQRLIDHTQCLRVRREPGLS